MRSLKDENGKRPYVAPAIEILSNNIDHTILAGSPAVQPGGGGGGSISVEPPKKDEDEEIFGAKHSNMWGDRED